MRMPFGKHKGKPMEDIPVDYFEWCLRELEDLSPSLRDEMQNQIDLKAGKGVRRVEGKMEGRKFRY
jgi:exodeoxyribonuclease X